MVAVGEHSNADINFAGVTLSADPQMMILAWGPLSSKNVRQERWATEFGGQNGSGEATDIDAHGGSKRIVVVGNYQDNGTGHTHLDGSPANKAVNTNYFLQALDFDGSHTYAYSSTGVPADPSDTVMADHVEFANDGQVYIAGEFHGTMNPNDNLLGTQAPPVVADNSGSDFDYFVVRFRSADQMGGPQKFPTWVNYSNFNASNTSSPTIITERIRDMHAYDNAVAITGSFANPEVEGSQVRGFAHIHDFSGFFTPGTRDPRFVSDYDVNLSNPTFPFFGRAVTATGSRLTIGGRNLDTNYDLGGPTLPGGFGFLVSYSY
jgi:hypothetical protein